MLETRKARALAREKNQRPLLCLPLFPRPLTLWVISAFFFSLAATTAAEAARATNRRAIDRVFIVFPCAVLSLLLETTAGFFL